MQKTPEQIIGERMTAGEAVGEGWLYGSLAVGLIAARLVDQDTMTRYRSAAFHARRMIYGVEKAL